MIVQRGTPFPVTQPVSDESESLQADVMRFMAILGLCLMVIFALVQSLSMLPEDREQARQQEARIAELRNQHDASERRATELDVTLQTERSQRDAMAADLEALQADYDGQTQALAEQMALNHTLENSVETLQRALEAIEFQREQLNAEVTALSEALQQAQRPAPDINPVAVEQRPESPTTEPVDNDASPSADAEPAQREPPAKPEGYSLKFASESAFYAQVASGGVKVYARVDGSGWALEANGKRMVPSELPGSFREMAQNTIPAALPQLLQRAGGRGDDITWGVVLSESTLRSIRSLMQTSTGGVLKILENGRVELE